MKIFITRKIPEEGLKILKRKHEIELNPYDRVLTKREIIRGLKGKEGLLSLLTDKIDYDIINSEERLKMIANYAVGFNNIDVEAATKKNIPVSNTPGILTDTTAEMAWALLLSATRRIVEGDRFTRGKNFQGWSPTLMLGQDVTKKTLGIIGAGRIGVAFASKSIGFEMKVLYHDQVKNKFLEEKIGAKKVDLSELLRKSDFISLHVPLLNSTYHLIGEKELRKMKKNAILINTSRGEIIDEKSLVKALKKKWIFGAGLDVYENEPDIEQGLLNMNNVVLQPHSASATIETRTKMAVMAAENMIKGLNGEIPPNCVNKEIFRKKNNL